MPQWAHMAADKECRKKASSIEEAFLVTRGGGQGAVSELIKLYLNVFAVEFGEDLAAELFF